MILAAIKVIRHCIMGGIQKPLFDMKLRKESFHSEISLQKTMGSCLEAGFKIGKTGRSLSESEATIMYRSYP